jgi:hypothetical protein
MFVVIVLSVNMPCFAFDNQITHPDLTKKSVINSSLEGYLTSTLGLTNGLKTTFNGFEITRVRSQSSIWFQSPIE